MKEFISICKQTQADLKQYVINKLQTTHGKVIADDGYVYAQGSFPVLLVAHMDTVHKNLPSNIMYDPVTMTVSSADGIGGDDQFIGLHDAPIDIGLGTGNISSRFHFR